MNTIQGERMKKCLFSKINIEQVEHAPEVRQIGEEVKRLVAQLLPSLTPEQKELYRKIDDAVVTEGTARVNAAIRAACGCIKCQQGSD